MDENIFGDTGQKAIGCVTYNCRDLGVCLDSEKVKENIWVKANN